jgi:hypothetical protein
MPANAPGTFSTGPGAYAIAVIADKVIKDARIVSHTVLLTVAKDIGCLEAETTPLVIASLHRRFLIGPFGFDGPLMYEYGVVLRKPRKQCKSGRRSKHAWRV